MINDADRSRGGSLELFPLKPYYFVFTGVFLKNDVKSAS